MKSVFFFFALFLFSGVMTAQSSPKIKVFISPLLQISEVKSQNTISFGFGGGVQFGDLYLGGFHMQTPHSIVSSNRQTIRTGDIKATGLWFGKYYPISDFQRVSIGAKTAIQTVAVSLLETKAKDIAIHDRFWTISPEAGTEWRVGNSSWIGVTAAYQVVGSLNNINFLEEKDLNGLLLILSWKIGT